MQYAVAFQNPRGTIELLDAPCQTILDAVLIAREALYDGTPKAMIYGVVPDVRTPRYTRVVTYSNDAGQVEVTSS